MSGWQRLGIVLTIIYILAVSGFGIYSYQNTDFVVPELKVSSFFAKYKKISLEQRNKVIDSRKSKYRACLEDGSIEDKLLCEAVYLFEPNFIKQSNVVGIIFILIVLPAQLWLVAWAFISIIGWVRKGF